MTTLLGLDLGTSSFKVSAHEVGGAQLGEVGRRTPWVRRPDGTQMDPGTFESVVRALVDECVESYAVGPVVGVGVTGMAETMFVETDDGRLLAARAWNDRGHRAPVEPDADAFSRTGLVEPARAPVVELRRLADEGTVVRSWTGLPERAVRVLGGDGVCERSLSSRTGLVDVVSGDWDAELLAWAGVGHVAVPDLRPAGRHCGVVRHGAGAGAALTVAGHDHVTAVVGAGADDVGAVFDSIGTGEAVITRIATRGGELDSAAVRAFTAAGFNVGLGVDDDDRVAFAGLGTGNRFNLLLDALDRAGFARSDVLDADAAPGGEQQDALLTRLPDPVRDLLALAFGPRWQVLRTSDAVDEVIRGAVHDLSAARTLWWAAVVRGSSNARAALDALSPLAPRATRLVAAGGWLGNAGVRAVRERVLGAFTVPGVEQCGARGAALLAGLAAGAYRSRDDFPPAATEE